MRRYEDDDDDDMQMCLHGFNVYCRNVLSAFYSIFMKILEINLLNISFIHINGGKKIHHQHHKMYIFDFLP